MPLSIFFIYFDSAAGLRRNFFSQSPTIIFSTLTVAAIIFRRRRHFWAVTLQIIYASARERQRRAVADGRFETFRLMSGARFLCWLLIFPAAKCALLTHDFAPPARQATPAHIELTLTAVATQQAVIVGDDFHGFYAGLFSFAVSLLRSYLSHII